MRHPGQRDLTFRFVSYIDGTDFAEATRDLDAEETLFIIASKIFTTLAPMTNADMARDRALKTVKDPAAIARHFVLVSTNAGEVAKFDVDTKAVVGKYAPRNSSPDWQRTSANDMSTRLRWGDKRWYSATGSAASR